METLDWIVIGLFCLALVGIIVWVMRQKQDDSKDYFLGGRDATWIAIGASIFASNIGSEHLIGLAGAGASSGMAMAHWEIQGWMILLLGWVFVPFYSRSMVYTMPVSRAPLQPAITHYFVSDFSHQLCPHQSGRNRICRRIGFPAGLRHRYFMGNRLLLDSRHRIGCHYGALHDFRRYEIGTLHLGIANAYTSSRIAYHLGSRI